MSGTIQPFIMRTEVDVPRQQTAIIAGQSGDFEISTSTPVPTLEPDEILIRTHTVALNPVDTKLTGGFVTPGCIFGFDCSGIIVMVGKDVRRDLKVGDRVCGSGSGSKFTNPSDKTVTSSTILYLCH